MIQPPASDLVAIIQISNQSRLMLAVDGEVIDNRLGSSGRLAHLPVEGNDRPCECGRTGCLGTVSSGAAVVRVYRELTDIQLDAGVDVIDRVHRGDPDAIEAARRSTEWLSRALGPPPDGAAGPADRHRSSQARGKPRGGGARRNVAFPSRRRSSLRTDPRRPTRVRHHRRVTRLGAAGLSGTARPQMVQVSGRCPVGTPNDGGRFSRKDWRASAASAVLRIST
ncbi:MAG: ROK family protein [Acidimicrobiales bacterium]